jgi:hypothetical protein
MDEKSPSINFTADTARERGTTLQNNLYLLKKRYDLTSARIGVLTGTSQRTVRQWLAPNDSLGHVDIPRSAWWLLRILLGEAIPAEIIREAEERIVVRDQTKGRDR